jgi:hypothetical protein
VAGGGSNGRKSFTQSKTGRFLDRAEAQLKESKELGQSTKKSIREARKALGGRKSK